MFEPGSSTRQQLDELQSTLDLRGAGQDWGIENADGTRVREFVSFFDRHYNETWSGSTVAEFVDLVLESTSDALDADPHFNIGCIDTFVERAASLAPDRFEYWTADDWPVAPHLRRLGH